MSTNKTVEWEKIDEYISDVVYELENRSLQDVFTKAKDMILNDVGDAFASSMSPSGEIWPPRKKIGDGHPLLIDTTKLMNAALGAAEGHIATIAERDLIIGVSVDVVPYAGVHQYGSIKRNIPRRTYFGMKEDTKNQIGEMIADEMINAF